MTMSSSRSSPPSRRPTSNAFVASLRTTTAIDIDENTLFQHHGHGLHVTRQSAEDFPAVISTYADISKSGKVKAEDITPRDRVLSVPRPLRLLPGQDDHRADQQRFLADQQSDSTVRASSPSTCCRNYNVEMAQNLIPPESSLTSRSPRPARKLPVPATYEAFALNGAP